MPTLLQSHLHTIIPNSQLLRTHLPQCPDIQLWLLSSSYPNANLSQEQILKLMDLPPYWAFCWPSGQVLAQLIMNKPSAVRNKTLLDFGAGSGVVAIAAKIAGAKRVIVCDEDPLALEACRANALLNKVDIDTCNNFETAPKADIITIADVFYDRENLPLLEGMLTKYKHIWVTDSRMKGAPLQGLTAYKKYSSYTVPKTDDSCEFNEVTFYSRYEVFN